MPDPRRILEETLAARQQAEALLRSLQEARTQSERHLAEAKQADPFKTVTGRSALENAIASTQRMIETLNRAITQVRKDLTDDDGRPAAGEGSGRPREV